MNNMEHPPELPVASASMRGMRGWQIALLLAVIGLVALFALGLRNDPKRIPSPLMSRPAPDFTLDALDGGAPVRLSAHAGKWVLVNFWGSWCVSCVAEHPYLIRLSRQVRQREDFRMIGVAFKDNRSSALAFLDRHGHPEYRHGFDPEQRTAIDWGVYGAPESYLVDPAGIIRVKHAGPLYDGPPGESWFERVALPLMEGRQQP
jgi:cytochrome c biogenesis protein CcmG/thiol:disulfide interchange protein DsbE